MRLLSSNVPMIVEMKNDPIIVTEIPRSGAAMIAHVLKACGAWVSPSETEDSSHRIRETLVRPLMKGLHADTMGLKNFPDMEACKNTAPKIEVVWRRQVLATLNAQGYESGPWFYQGPDALLVWPVWHSAFPEARWVIARRDDNAIIRSCSKTAFANVEKTPDEFMVWIEEYKSRMRGLIDSGSQVLQTWPDRFIGGKMDDLQRLVRSLSLEWNGEAVQDALSPVMWRHGQFEIEGVSQNG